MTNQEIIERVIKKAERNGYKGLISQEQFDFIERFADVKWDAENNKTYIINELRFRIVPHFAKK
jgi:hypothetical protein